MLVHSLQAQNSTFKPGAQYVLSDFQSRASEFGLTSDDVLGSRVTDLYTDKHNGVTHAYIQQYLNARPIINQVIGLHYNRNGRLVFWANNFTPDAKSKITSISAVKSNQEIINLAMKATATETNVGDFQVVSDIYKRSLSEADKLLYPCYYANENGIHPAYNVIYFDIKTSDWWNIIVSENGDILDKLSWTSHCSLNAPHNVKRRASNADATYHALKFNIESPLYGKRSILLNPNDSLASPFGWHDVDGAAGAEFTTTIGNNVLASEDHDGNNIAGFSPDGGSSLLFDFSYDSAEIDPLNYESYAITNLFVVNNLMHDILYGYGFDENAGNFQLNNYGRGGAGSDEVNADAQDGSGTNNANFSTPPDGSNPRMQMFIWDADAGTNGATLQVNSTGGSKFRVGKAVFGTSLSTTPITAMLVMVDDGVGTGEKGCSALKNGIKIKNNIAAIERGGCTFVEKVYNAQLAGAIAVVVLDTFEGDQIILMGGSDSRITIPAVFARFSDANELFELMLTGTVNISLYDSTGFVPKTDSDLDLGVIAHEYTHGVSNRLTCGPSNSNALNNAEQMGEGWSDFLGLALTVKMGDVGTTARGIGNWLIGQDQKGGGIRTYPYSTSMTINPHTYKNVKTASSGGRTEVHYLGEVWCAMLWDLHWKLVEKYGYDPDLYHGTGGNNTAIQLVLDGMKLQKCNPGFVDGRNAILMADSLNNGAANSDLIWQVFARRGLGFSASQGSSFSTGDGVEAFDLPGQQSRVVNLKTQFASIRPNPVQNILYVEPASLQSLENLRIMDATGRNISVSMRRYSDGYWMVNTEELRVGIYFLHVETNTGVQVMQFIKN